MTTDQHHLLIHAYGADAQATLTAALRVSRNAVAALDPGTSIHLVVQGPAVAALVEGSSVQQEVQGVIQERGVMVVACENSMAGVGISVSDLIPGVTATPAAIAYLAQKQWQGWAYVRI